MKNIILIGLALLMLTNLGHAQINDDSDIITGVITKFKIINKTGLTLTLQTTDWEGDENIISLTPNDSTEMAPMFLHLNGDKCAIDIFLNYNGCSIKLFSSQIPQGVWIISCDDLKKMLIQRNFKISPLAQNKTPIL